MATYKVNGMTCGGCVKAVENAMRRAAPQARAAVALDTGTLAVEGAEEEIVRRAVEDAGFVFAGRA
ncbi:MAG: heavy-metal-associated domain-containing protein [Alphaproteobacteria bacterium]|nr:heavy-metal-associated domain-containing protein [Alphaproteobacteria bacterium]